MAEEYEPMFHYLLEMHKDGKSLCRLELNVPCAIFRDVQVNSFRTLEAMLVDFGKTHGLVVAKEMDATHSPSEPSEVEKE